VSDQERLYAELASLTSTDRRLGASEERRRAWLIQELAQEETAKGYAEVLALRDQWAELEHPRERDADERV
jgi:hypothetical protein